MTNTLKVPKDIKYPVIVVAGCARSGTAFMAKLLTQGGIVCNHEILFGAPGYGEIRDEAIAESSWLATPYLAREKIRGAITMQIVRHPLKHISSMNHVHTLEDHNFRANIYTIYKKLYLPTLDRMRVMDRYIFNWIKWNQMAEKHADFIYRLEDLVEKPGEVFEDLGWDVGKKTLNTKKVNSYSNVEQLDWKDLRECLYYYELLQAAHHYKYINDKEFEDLKKLKVDKFEKIGKQNIIK